MIFPEIWSVPLDCFRYQSISCIPQLDGKQERLSNGQKDPRIDYRVLQPTLLTDSSGNRTEMAFDVLDMVAGTAVKGKEDTVGETLGDEFEPDITQDQVQIHFHSFF